MQSKRNVWVIQGRNQEVNASFSRLISAIGLQQVTWEDGIAYTRKASPSSQEILRKTFALSQAVVVLLTGDDFARLNPKFLTDNDNEYERTDWPQARPNVIFEAGMALAENENCTVFVEIGIVRPFSDIAGIQSIRLDNSIEKRDNLIKRLKIAGCEVNLENDLWKTAGDFESTRICGEPEKLCQINRVSPADEGSERRAPENAEFPRIKKDSTADEESAIEALICEVLKDGRLTDGASIAAMTNLDRKTCIKILEKLRYDDIVRSLTMGGKILYKIK